MTGQFLIPDLSDIKILVLSNSLLYYLWVGRVGSGVVCPITWQKKSCRFHDSKNARRANTRDPHFTFSLSIEDKAEPYILWRSGLSYVWAWVSYSWGMVLRAGQPSGHKKARFWLLPSAPMANGLLEKFIPSLSCFHFFMWHQPSPSSALLSRKHHGVVHCLPHSWGAHSKHIERRLHLECGEFSDLTILHFSPE